jgi:hypothetical protein
MARLLVLFVLSLGWTSPAWAQRYLSEFVGTSVVAATTGAVTIQTDLRFDTLDSRSLTGAFSFVERDAFGGVEVEPFSVSATLAASGTCPARLTGDSTSGHLALDEYNFDTSTFALYGSLDLDGDDGAVSLSTKRLTGPVALLNPPADALDILAEKAVFTRGEDEYDVVITDIEENRAARGAATDASGAEAFEVVLSANAKWLYVVLTTSDSVLVGRGAVELDADGAPSAAKGTFEELSATGKTLDSGTFTVSLY